MHKFLERLAKTSYYKPADSDKEFCNENEKKKFLNYLNLLGQHDSAKLLLRGTTVEKLKSIFVSKLNSDNSLFDGLFLVGEKAKNYFEKSKTIPHPVKMIDSMGAEVGNWIFEEYSKLPPEKIKTDYFKTKTNCPKFVTAIKGERKLIDYYLAGLHKWESGFLVNFVSTTSSSDVAFSHENDLVILLWLKENFAVHATDELTLEKIRIQKLPYLGEVHEDECEYSFKGFIPPHFILGALSVHEDIFIVNPALLDNVDMNWIENGFEIDNETFLNFIKTTKYKRFLILHEDGLFEEKNLK